MSQSDNLVNLFEKKEIVKVCGAYDAMSAKLVETHGFDAVWAGSFAISAILTRGLHFSMKNWKWNYYYQSHLP